MRMKKNSLFLLLCISLVSCNKDNETTLNVSESELQIESAGGMKSINITSNTDGSISGTIEWCTVNLIQFLPYAEELKGITHLTVTGR